MSDSSPGEPPQYNVYRSRKRLRDRIGGGGSKNPLEALRRRRGAPKAPGEPTKPGGITPRRVLKWVVLAIAGWILVAIVSFFISAQVNGGVDDKTKEALSGGGSVLTGSNVLVLGSDERPKGSKEPGAQSGSARSDSIIVMHVGFGSVRKISILRDSQADIPGDGTQKINAAYALGGAPLTIKTVEQFLGNGLKINHVILVSFTNFPNLIDALGGVDVKLKRCIHSNSFSGQTVKLSRGEHHLSGQDALNFSRVRKNACAPNEDDRARAARQQQVIASMRDQIVSPVNWPSTFLRGPFIAWQAPQAIRSDMHGPGLAALLTDLLTGGSGKTKVLLPDAGQPFINGGVNVTPSERADAVDYLEGK